MWAVSAQAAWVARMKKIEKKRPKNRLGGNPVRDMFIFFILQGIAIF
jgi:hypothetical protein